MRTATHAGSWYPGDAVTLRREIDSRLSRSKPERTTDPIIALIAPHAGLRFSGEVAAAGYQALAGQPVKRAFLLGPSHHQAFTGVALPADDVTAYETPLGNLRIDAAAVRALRGQPGFAGPSRVHEPEHSLEMHAIFLAAVKPDVLLVPLVVGQVDAALARTVATSIRTLVRPGDVVLVSSDFTHYGPGFGYVPFAKDVPARLDGLMKTAFAALEARSGEAFEAHLDKTGDTICGREPIRILLSMLPDAAAATRLAQDTSGRMTGDFGSSVSYLTVAYRAPGGWTALAAANDADFEQGPTVLDRAQQEQALRIARTTLVAFLEEDQTPSDADLGVPPAGPFRGTFSVFVTLKKHGELRGCIGHIRPIQPLWRDIRDNAIAAAVHDPRFSPVTADELLRLHLEISVLTPPRPVPRAEDFIVGKHGVILSLHGRSAVFLPQVAPEQGWDRATTLSHLANKAGLPGDAWRDPAATFEVFEAQVFAEPE